MNDHSNGRDVPRCQRCDSGALRVGRLDRAFALMQRPTGRVASVAQAIGFILLGMSLGVILAAIIWRLTHHAL